MPTRCEKLQEQRLAVQGLYDQLQQVFKEGQAQRDLSKLKSALTLKAQLEKAMAELKRDTLYL